jgi:hypothetical protein
MKRSLVVLVCLLASVFVMSAPAFAALTIADYESGAVSPNSLSGAVGGMSGDGLHDPVLVVVSTTAAQGSRSLELTYNLPAAQWCGIWQKVNAGGTTINASAYQSIHLWAKGKAGGEKFKVELKDGSSHSAQVSIDSLTGFTGGLSTTFQEIVIPLTSFTGVLTNGILEINYVIDAAGSGTIYLDNVSFVEATSGGGSSTGTVNTLVFANYESGSASPNNLGGNTGGMSPDSHDPTITVVSSPVQEGSKALSMQYNFSTSTGGGWCGMWQQLAVGGAGYDVSGYDTFKLYVAGSVGGEKFKIEMKDVAGNTATVNITSLTGFSGGLTTAYQEVVIPLASFSGVSMSTLKEINYVCDQTPNNRTIYIDNVRFTGAATGGSTTVTVTVKNYTVSVNVTGTVNLGQLIVGATGYAASAVVVENSGNVKESFWLSLTNPSGWTSASTSGDNQFVLMGAFDATGGALFPWNVANDVVTTSPSKASATRFAGSQSGLGVDIGGSRNLWFAFGAPTHTTVETAQVIPVTITASIEQ